MPQKILLLKGLPGSGKSTYARELLKKEPGKWKRVNKDDLRAMLDDSKWSKGNEQFIIWIRNHIIRTSLEEGFNVIVDDTNFEQKHEDNIREITLSYRPEIEVKFFDVSVEECVARDAKRPKPVGEDVIRGMYKKYLYTKPEPPARIPGMPEAVICDIDGTLAIMNNRSAFQWHLVGQDMVNNTIFELLKTFRRENDEFSSPDDYKLIIVSGRDSICRYETERWLMKYGVDYDFLYMRPEGDNRKDSIVKKEIYDTYIKDKFNIRLVLDDRNQVVEMWRSLGLTCLQVAPGAF